MGGNALDEPGADACEAGGQADAGKRSPLAACMAVQLIGVAVAMVLLMRLLANGKYNGIVQDDGLCSEEGCGVGVGLRQSMQSFVTSSVQTRFCRVPSGKRMPRPSMTASHSLQSS